MTYRYIAYMLSSVHMYMSLLFQRVTEKCDELSKELEMQTAICQVVSYTILLYVC